MISSLITSCAIIIASVEFVLYLFDGITHLSVTDEYTDRRYSISRMLSVYIDPHNSLHSSTSLDRTIHRELCDFFFRLNFLFQLLLRRPLNTTMLKFLIIPSESSTGSFLSISFLTFLTNHSLYTLTFLYIHLLHHVSRSSSLDLIRSLYRSSSFSLTG